MPQEIRAVGVAVAAPINVNQKGDTYYEHVIL